MSKDFKGKGAKQGFQPPTEEKKLEKQLRVLREKQFELSTEPQKWTVAKDTKHDDAYVIMLGKTESESVSQLVLHRKIGSDYQLDGNDWIMSSAGDMSQFMANQKFPGEAKIVKALDTLKCDTGVKLGFLKKLNDDYYYPGDLGNREEVLQHAREISSMHSKVKGTTHYGAWLLYASPAVVNAELAFQACLVVNPEFAGEKLRVLQELMAFQTTLYDGTRQKAVPYLRGAAPGEVHKLLYQHLQGVVTPPRVEPVRHVGVLIRKTFRDYKPGDESQRISLIKDLQNHANALKEHNIAVEALKKAKKDKSDLDDYVVDLKAKTDDLDEAILAVKASEGGKKPSCDVMEQSEFAMNPKLPLKEILKGIPKKKEAWGDEVSGAP
jgi:hypothetical protein